MVQQLQFRYLTWPLIDIIVTRMACHMKLVIHGYVSQLYPISHYLPILVCYQYRHPCLQCLTPAVDGQCGPWNPWSVTPTILERFYCRWSTPRPFLVILVIWDCTYFEFIDSNFYLSIYLSIYIYIYLHLHLHLYLINIYTVTYINVIQCIQCL